MKTIFFLISLWDIVCHGAIELLLPALDIEVNEYNCVRALGLWNAIAEFAESEGAKEQKGRAHKIGLIPQDNLLN